MRKIVAGAMVSMDGIMQAPGGPTEDPTGGFQFGGWVMPFFDSVFAEEVDGLGQPGLIRDEDQIGVRRGQARVELAHGHAGLRVGGGEGHLELRMGRAQPEQLRASEPRGPDHPDRCHRLSIRSSE